MKVITNENYYDDTEYMSVSRYKMLSKCELSGRLPFGTPSDSMMIGSYVDAFVEGTLDEFIKNNPSIFITRYEENENTKKMLSKYGNTYITRNNTFNSKNYPDAKKYHPECFIVTHTLKSEYNKAKEICDYIQNDSVFSQFMSGEKQTIMTGEISNIPFKIKMDSYSPGIAINDLKVMRSVTDKDGNFYDFITPWGYDLQLACYQEIVYQNTGEKLPCYICAVSKTSPINSVIVNIPQHILDVRLYDVQCNIRHLYNVLQGIETVNGCGHCAYCLMSRKNTPIISLEDMI